MSRNFIVGIIVFLFGALIALGQTGTLSGTITDPSGKPVPNSVITITNSSTGMSQRVVTGPDGAFMVAIPPGTYKVEVETTGFKRMIVQTVEINAGTGNHITGKLEAGPAVETVEINADAVETQDTPPEVQRGYSSNALQAVPVFDRNYSQLINLMPGVTPPVTNYDVNFGVTQDPQRSRQFNTNGLPVWANDHTLDGDTIREPFTGVLSTHIAPNEDVRELEVTTTNYRAETGFAGGSVDNVFSRPGTAGFHGNLYGFHSNPFFQARNPMYIGANPTSPLHWWQAGGGVGGAIVPEHTFFYANYDATLYKDANVQLGTVPTPALLSGNFSGTGATIYNPTTGTTAGNNRTPFTGGMIPANQINPLSLSILNSLPAANLPGLTNNFVSSVPFEDNGHIADGRLDQRFSNGFAAFLDYGFSYFNASQGGLLGPVVGGGSASALRNQHAALSLMGNHHGIIGELRFAYNRYRNAINPTDLTGTLNPALTAAGFTSFPTISVTGWGVLGQAPNVPGKMIDNMFEGSANFHWARGIQDFRFGTDIRAMQANGWFNYPFGPNGAVFFGPGTTLAGNLAGSANVANTYFNSLAAFLTGNPVASGIFTSSTTPAYRQNQYSGYIADSIRLTPRFTVELGFRYDVFSPVGMRYDNGAFLFNPVTGTNTFSNGAGDYDLNNWAPRVGFAFQALSRTVIRASYGMYYFPTPFMLSPINLAGVGNQAGLINGSFMSVPFRVPSTTGATTTSAANIPLNVQTHVETPYTQNYFFMIQQDLTHGALFDVAYVGNLGRQLPYINALNVANPGTGVAGLPFTGTAGVNEIGTGLTSNYNSLHVNLTKRLSRGIGFSVAYTWSKALDYGTDLIDPLNRSLNYGPADWDRTQMLTLSHVFELPFGTGANHLNTGVVGQILAGWQLSGLFQWGTGAPYSVLAPATGCNCPGVAAVYASAAQLGSINGQASFNPSFFAGAAAGTFGIDARNAFRGPDFHTYNLALAKSFRIAEQAKMEFRGEAFNILNSPFWGAPYSNLGNPNFGQPSLVTSNLPSGFAPRTFVVAARILF